MDPQGLQALISALQGPGYPFQPVADLKKQMPFEAGGGAPTNSLYVPRGAEEGVQSSRRDAISQGLQAGKSYGQIAKELGISRNAVAGTVRDQGLTQNPLGQRDPYALDPVELARTRARLNPGKVDPELRGAAADAQAGLQRAPQIFGQGTPTGPQPSMPQLKSLATPAPADDPEMARAMTNYLRSMGIIE